MTEMVRPDQSMAMPSTEISVPDHDLGEVLDLVASATAALMASNRGVRLVMRGRRGALVSSSGGRLCDRPRGARENDHREAVEETLNTGTMVRGDGVATAPIAVGRRVIGVLVVTVPSGCVTDTDLRTATSSLARHVSALDNAMALAEARGRAANLERAMQSRAVIEQAKGVLMARHRLDAGAAFAMLRDRSQRGDVKVADVAAQLVAEVVDPSLAAVTPARDAGHWDVNRPAS
jgi:hypothetical protein